MCVRVGRNARLGRRIFFDLLATTATAEEGLPPRPERGGEQAAHNHHISMHARLLLRNPIRIGTQGLIVGQEIGNSNSACRN